MDLKEIITTIMSAIVLLVLIVLVIILVVTFLRKEYSKYLRKIDLQIKTYELLNEFLSKKINNSDNDVVDGAFVNDK